MPPDGDRAVNGLRPDGNVLNLKPPQAQTLVSTESRGAAECSASLAVDAQAVLALPALPAVGEYNGKFMSGQFVLRGAPRVTPLGHLSAQLSQFLPRAHVGNSRFSA